jgi:hypothetical protein
MGNIHIAGYPRDCAIEHHNIRVGRVAAKRLGATPCKNLILQ